MPKSIRKQIEETALEIFEAEVVPPSFAIDKLTNLFSKILDDLLKRGHGGGNWRRLIIQIRKELNA